MTHGSTSPSKIGEFRLLWLYDTAELLRRISGSSEARYIISQSYSYIAIQLAWLSVVIR